MSRKHAIRKFTPAFAGALAGLLMGASTVNAATFGTNITVSDNSFKGSGWYSDREDNEVEPANLAAQIWDLEAIFQDGFNLTLAGGFNFLSGQGGYTSGNLFFDTNKDFRQTGLDPQGDANEVVNDTYGYDYAVDMDIAAGRYWVYAMSSSWTVTVFYDKNQKSNPWRLHNPDPNKLVGTGTLNYFTGLAGNDARFSTPLLDGSGSTTTKRHYALELVGVLDFPGLRGNEFTAHFTYGCGNDNLLGQGTAPVPIPASALLLGSGLAGLALFCRRKRS